MTPLEHAWEIRREYGYRDFAEAEEELKSFLSARCATSAEGPKALFDGATAWLAERKVLLPGVTTLARLVASLRAEAAEQLALQIVKGIDVGLRDRLNGLLELTRPPGSNRTGTYAKRGHRVRVAAGVVWQQARGSA